MQRAEIGSRKSFRSIESDPIDDQDVMVGVIDVASAEIETPEEIADTIGRALQFVPKHRLIACTNCGLAPMTRDVAERKLKALAEGARLASQRYA
jgi:5-methyltetrahydropteroyltriglutamate--homocysteine methyltransferase